jgi:hypothetical protein
MRLTRPDFVESFADQMSIDRPCHYQRRRPFSLSLPQKRPELRCNDIVCFSLVISPIKINVTFKRPELRCNYIVCFSLVLSPIKINVTFRSSAGRQARPKVYIQLET